jgi:hypothetical protein
MRSKRPKYVAPAIDAVAEELPFGRDTFDAALACITVHQWRDLDGGLAEMRRVTKGPVVIVTFDPKALRDFWLADYAPEMMEKECGRMPPIGLLTDRLGGDVSIEHVPIPAGCVDGFTEAFFGRPEAFLDDRVRRAQSAWSFVDADTELRSVNTLRSALGRGDWDAHHGELRMAPEYAGSLRLVVSRPT